MKNEKVVAETIRRAEQLLDEAERQLDEGEPHRAEEIDQDAKKSEVILIIDRSGSMASIAADMQDSIRTLLRDQLRSVENVSLTACFFDDEYLLPYESRPLSESIIDSIELIPRGSTALFDAIGRTLCGAVSRIPMNRRVVVVIITDGMENASVEFSGEAVERLIRQCKQRRDWQFIFLGTSEAQIQQAAEMNIDGARAIAYGKNPESVKAMRSIIGLKITRYCGGADKGELDFTEQERSMIEKTRQQKRTPHNQK